MSLSVGLNCAITTLTGQARGQLLAQGEVMKREGAWREKRRQEGGDGTSTPTAPPLGEVVVNVATHDEASALLNDDLAHQYRTAAPLPSINNGNSDADTHSSEHLDPDEIPILPLVFLYRGIFIQLAFVLPVGVYWLCGMKPLLLFLGQGEDIYNDRAISSNIDTWTVVLLHKLDLNLLVASNRAGGRPSLGSICRSCFAHTLQFVFYTRGGTRMVGSRRSNDAVSSDSATCNVYISQSDGARPLPFAAARWSKGCR